MLPSDGKTTKVNNISYDEVTDISESVGTSFGSDVRQNSPFLAENNQQEYKSKENLNSEGYSQQKPLTMSNLKMAGQDFDPDKDETEVGFFQENQPNLTYEVDEATELEPFQDDDDDDDLNVIPMNNIGNIGGTFQKKPQFATQAAPSHIMARNMTSLSRNMSTLSADTNQEVVLFQENQPNLTHEVDEAQPFQDDDDDDDLDVIPMNDPGNAGGTFQESQQPEGVTQVAPAQLTGENMAPMSGNMAPLSENMATLSADANQFPDQFPDASDAISFNLADEQTEEEEDEQGPPGPSGPVGPANFPMPAASMKSRVGPMEGPHNNLPPTQIDSPGGGDEDDDDDDDDDDVQAPLPEGSYDPGEYANLDVPPELKELFNYISNYTPQNIELEHKLRPFIPDYIPAVGDIDAFIKIPRPDGEASTVGLTVLDEPSAKQSDSTVLDLQLRAVARHTTAKSVVVKSIENAENNGKVIEKWMRDISDLHRAKPPPTVHYSKRMPDIDSLMQEWPGEIEELLKELSLPSAELQVELPHYVDLICSILDIPVYKSRIQSLHVFFTLFSVFKNSAHFRHLAEENVMENEPTNQEPDMFVL